MAEGNSTPESPPPPINTKSQESSVASASEALVPAEVVAKPPIAQTEEITEQEGGLLGDRLTKKAQDRLEQDWETKLADLADATATIKLRDVAERWSKDQDNIYLQMLVRRLTLPRLTKMAYSNSSSNVSVGRRTSI